MSPALRATVIQVDSSCDWVLQKNEEPTAKVVIGQLF
jgi:hypothetical protein